MLKLVRPPLYFPHERAPHVFSEYNPADPYFRLKDDYGASRGPYGKHRSLDIGAPQGTPIVSPISGRVVKAEFQELGGWIVTVATVMRPSGLTAWAYHAHMFKRPFVRVGDQVQPGTPLGVVGQSGNAAGPHLHFTLFVESAPGKGDFNSNTYNPYSQLVGLTFPKSDKEMGLRGFKEDPDYIMHITPMVRAMWTAVSTSTQKGNQK